MPDPERSADPAHPVRHETSDISFRFVAFFLTALVIAAVVIHFALWVMFEYFAAREGRGDQPLLPFIVAETPREPPEPRLQISPPADLAGLQRAARERLTRYGWVDRESGVVRIPIERAMELIVERGLPPAGGGAPDRSDTEQR